MNTIADAVRGFSMVTLSYLEKIAAQKSFIRRSMFKTAEPFNEELLVAA